MTSPCLPMFSGAGDRTMIAELARVDGVDALARALRVHGPDNNVLPSLLTCCDAVIGSTATNVGLVSSVRAMCAARTGRFDKLSSAMVHVLTDAHDVKTMSALCAALSALAMRPPGHSRAGAPRFVGLIAPRWVSHAIRSVSISLFCPSLLSH